MNQKYLLCGVVGFSLAFLLYFFYHWMVVGEDLSRMPGIVWLFPAFALICEIALFTSRVLAKHFPPQDAEK